MTPVDTFDVRSADGTLLRAWRNDGAGVPLVVSNGLGAGPQAWPGLLDPAAGYRACGWYHRGTSGSQRPADPARVRVQDHVEDLLALLDAEGVERALVACWSLGVNVGFELAARHPDRVAGLLAVSGVPGGSFAAMGGPLRVPRGLRRPLSVGAARGLRAAAPVLDLLGPLVPADARTAWLLTHTGVLAAGTPPEVLVPVLQGFLRHDWGWYLHLALAASAHDVMDLAPVRCPVTLVAGRRDVFTSVHAVEQVALRLPDARVLVLPGSHFLLLEEPDRVLEALGELRGRTGL